MQMLINVPDTLPKALVQQRIKELEERLKQEAQQSQKPGGQVSDLTLQSGRALQLPSLTFP